MTYVEIETGIRCEDGKWGYDVHHWDVRLGEGGIPEDMRYKGVYECGGGHRTEESAREAAERRLTADYGERWEHI